MAISYNKLWKPLIDKGMKKTELVRLSGITSNAIKGFLSLENRCDFTPISCFLPPSPPRLCSAPLPRGAR